MVESGPSAFRTGVVLDRAFALAPIERCIRRGASGYPAALLDLARPPREVHVRGVLPPPGARAVAIVGSRAATGYGLERAERLAADLARLGIVIVSGLARGIDAAAHRSALEAGGVTVAVLPGGLAAITPVSHAPLAERIALRGALLSEWPRAVPARRGLFLRRNRLIAALAQATVVVEAAERSGALSTAAAAQGLARPVFAVPGDVDRPTSRGCNALLRSGARFCESAADIVRALPGGAPDSTGSDETRLAAALGAEPLPAEALAARAGVGLGRVLAALLHLEADEVRVAHPFETLLVRALAAGVRSLSWKRSLALGERLGDLARGLGLRRRVAEDNLARAFPERSIAERSAILREHYRELGRVVVEYARLDELARAPRGQVMAEIRGLAHIEAARGRGAILLTGHFGNFELGGATLGQLHPVDVVVRPLSNPGVEAILASARAAAGLTLIPADRGIRRVYESLHAGRWVAMVGDQDARRHGVFVPFMGRPASAALGPARIALATGASIIMGFMMRQTDGRMVLEVEPPLEIPDPGASDAALRLTALHTARLEARVRARPEMWFWVHRRWKTRPAGEPQPAAAPERSASPEESAARAPGDDTTARRTAAQAS